MQTGPSLGFSENGKKLRLDQTLKHYSSHSVPPNLLHLQPPNIFKSLTRAASSYLYRNSPAPASLVTSGYRFIHDLQTEFDHTYISFEGIGIHDDDIYELATMKVLLGCGGSFFASMHQTYLHTIDLLIFACRWTQQGYVLCSYPESQCGH
jgi:hypothetical protein